MSKFKMIEKLGLEIIAPYRASGTEMVRAEDLEDLLQSAQVVYGSPDTPRDQLAWSNTQLGCDTHKAFLLAVEPLKKQTKAEAALEFVESLAKDTTKFWNVATPDEAKRILEMKDEV